ncbi:hypothetical protein [Desulfobacter sp. UBA2225]|uniref:hypothetical protein n=1 Tax=Desulfobacter sp. UBA2225 TaxID=1961413 RepID=UPI00257CF596|nr:hypothetical protein [Desulfobacter sp. UBA2225]
MRLPWEFYWGIKTKTPDHKFSNQGRIGFDSQHVHLWRTISILAIRFVCTALPDLWQASLCLSSTYGQGLLALGRIRMVVDTDFILFSKVFLTSWGHRS